MSKFQSIRDLLRNAQCFVERHRLLSDALRHSRAFYEFHHEGASRARFLDSVN
jgi:hypothetical protein